MSILQKLHDSEINASISSFYDREWTAKLGDEMNGYDASRSCSSEAEALTWLDSTARALFPNSEYAKSPRGSSDGVEAAASLISEAGGYTGDPDARRLLRDAGNLLRSELNSYASSQAEIERLRDMLQSIKMYGYLANIPVDQGWGSSGKKPASKDVWCFPRHMLDDLEAALSGGKP